MSAYTVAVLADSPNLYVRLDDLSGTTCIAAVGNNGVYNAAPTLNQTGALTACGDTDPAVKFTAASSQFVQPVAINHTVQDVGDIFTIEAWVKRASTGAGVIHGVFLNSNESAAAQLGIFHDTVALINKGAVTTIAHSTVTITDTTTFHHIVATKSGATTKIYVDGADVTALDSDQTIPNPINSGWLIGWYNGAFFDGTIDEVALYPTALSAARVLAHYQAATTSGSSTKVPIDSFAYSSSVYARDSSYASTDAAVTAVPQMFIATGGAKTATTSFVYFDATLGRHRSIWAGDKVAVTDNAYIAAPGNFA